MVVDGELETDGWGVFESGMQDKTSKLERVIHLGFPFFFLYIPKKS